MRLLAEETAIWNRTAILYQGIVVVFPPSAVDTYSETVDILLGHMPGTIPGDKLSPSPPYRVAYRGNYVVYFTATPESVPGHIEADFATHDMRYPHFSDGGTGIREVITNQRAYIHLSTGFVAAVSSAVEPGYHVSHALDNIVMETNRVDEIPVEELLVDSVVIDECV